MSAPTSTKARPANPPATKQTVDIDLPNRSLEMNLMYEDMARAEQAERHEEARRMRVVHAVRAQRAARRAEEAALRARRLLVLAVSR